MEVLDPRWSDPAPPEAIADALRGRLVEQLGRRGKYLIAVARGRGAPRDAPAHDRQPAAHATTRRSRRTRGCASSSTTAAASCSSTCAASAPAMCCWGADALGRVLRSPGSGVEPLSPDFTAEALRAQARGRKQPVKAFLLNQERVAGVGNIYADEALFRARIHPLRPVGTLQAAADRGAARRGGGDARARHRRRRAPRSTTTATSTAPRGASRTASWCTPREGEPCPRCGNPIRKMRAAGRGTYVCERCQPRPRIRRDRRSGSA